MSGPIIVPSGSTPSGVARSLYRRKLLRRLGACGVYTTTAAASGGETTTAIVVAGLADDEIPLEQFAGRFLFVASGAEAGHQTTIRAAGTHGAPGVLEYTRPTSTVVASGVEIELSAVMPSGPYGECPNANEIVNEALDALPVHVDRDFTYVTQQVRYDLSGLVWRFRDTDVLDVYPPIASGMTAVQTTARPISRGLWSVQYDGESPYLQLHGWGANDGETFFVRLRRPASSYVNNNGWGDSSTGLTSDTMEALYDVDSVVNVALPIACDRLAGYWRARGDDGQADRWTRRHAETVAAGMGARLFRAFRSNGRQRVGAVGGRSW